MMRTDDVGCWVKFWTGSRCHIGQVWSQAPPEGWVWILSTRGEFYLADSYRRMQDTKGDPIICELCFGDAKYKTRMMEDFQAAPHYMCENCMKFQTQVRVEEEL